MKSEQARSQRIAHLRSYALRGESRKELHDRAVATWQVDSRTANSYVQVLVIQLKQKGYLIR